MKQRAAAIEAGLRDLDRRIEALQRRCSPSAHRPVVNAKDCVGCGMCRSVCPAGAIFVDEVARIDPSRCLGCGRCEAACPKGAIRLESGKDLVQRRVSAA